MKILELKNYSSIMRKHKSQILNNWLSFNDVIQTLKPYIDPKIFSKDYASLVLDYYFDVIDGKKEVGQCPIIKKFLDFFKEKGIPAHEIYTICSHMRIALIDFSFSNGFASQNIVYQISHIADKNLSGIMKLYGDIISEKIEETQEYSSLLKQYKNVINTSSIVTKTDLRGRITYANNNFCEISGYRRDELIGQPHNIVRHSKMTKNQFQDLWSTIQTKKAWNGLVINRSKNGKTYYVNTIVFPITNIENKIIEYMSIRHDLTDMFELNKHIEETQKEIIFKMGEVGETRSRETGNHVKRVAQYTRLLAEGMHIDTKEVDILVMASPMHDIGKIGIPDAILKKPGKLTDNEWEIMKTHADIGYSILKSSKWPIIKAAATVSREHHEHWDGNGYPRGLEGENIHIYGRITAVADVFDALSSDRVYKKAWPLEKVIEYLKEQKGKQFDPKLINIFLDNIDEFVKIKEKYVDTAREI